MLFFFKIIFTIYGFHCYVVKFSSKKKKFHSLVHVHYSNIIYLQGLKNAFFFTNIRKIWRVGNLFFLGDNAEFLLKNHEVCEMVMSRK